ncbi:MAG: plasmid stabilization protein [Myxococcota bacterium]
MASITIRNLDQATKELLRVRAATHGRSMEEEARDILRVALSAEESRVDLFSAIRRRFAPASGRCLLASQQNGSANSIHFYTGLLTCGETP